MKIKASFYFAFRSFIRNFAHSVRQRPVQCTTQAEAAERETENMKIESTNEHNTIMT